MPNEETTKIILEFPASNVKIELGTTITFDNISGSLNSDRVTVDSDTLTEKLSAMDSEIGEKADSDDVYDKTYIDNAFTGVNNSLNNKMDKANPTGTGRIAVGQGVVASGTNSQAFGTSSTASGLFSHAEGMLTTASGESSHAEGYLTTASGQHSHAEGYQTIASGRFQHVSGKYNVVDNNNTYAEIIGNGGNSYNRSNARTLDWQGNETLAGDLTFNGNKSLTSEISRLDGKIDNLPAPMIFKGTLGVGGTIQSLPTASASNEGWTYKVITDGTYAGQTAKVGDVFTSNGSEWVLIPAGDEDNDTWRNIKVNGVEKLGNGISSGAVDFEDTANVKFEFDANGNKIKAKLDGIYTESEVDDLLDDKADADNTYTKEQVDDIVYNILPDDTASGAIANFETSLALPLKSLEVDVNAVQASGTPTPSSPKVISGRSAISLVHCHKNLYQYDESKVSTGTTTTSTIRAYYPLGFKGVTSLTFSANLKSGSSITSSDYLNIGRLRKSDGLLEILSAFITPTDITTKTLSISSDDEVVLLSLEDPTVIKSILSRYDLQIEVGSSASTYESFNGTTAVINLGGTYYGGHFKQDKAGHRQLEVTYKRELLRNWTWTRNSTEYAFAYFSTTNVTDKANNKNFVCEIFANNNNYRANLSNSEIGVYNNTTGLRKFCVRYDEATTPEEFNTIIGDYAIIYELATPIIIDLPDGEPIITLNGTNNIYADTGDTEVVFKCSVNDYVSAHSGGNLLGMGGVYLGGAKSGGGEEEPTEDTEKVKLDETKVEVKTIGNTKKLGGE